jgi:hypothetical protein
MFWQVERIAELCVFAKWRRVVCSISRHGVMFAYIRVCKSASFTPLFCKQAFSIFRVFRNATSKQRILYGLCCLLVW